MANDRIYQEPTEVVVLPDSAKGRTYQEPAEVVVLPTSAKGRTYQLVVEAIYPSSNPTTPSGGTRIIWIG